MFKSGLFEDRVGAAALMSIIAMVSFNIAALNYPVEPPSTFTATAALHPVELA